MARNSNAVTAPLRALLEAQSQNGQNLANQGTSQTRPFVPYMDLGQGLNTRKDAHALARNELAVLINAWYAYGQSLAKRPGLTAQVTATGATGHAPTGITSLVAARFGGTSWLVVQAADNTIYYAPAVPPGSPFVWKRIGSVSGGILRGAQMYDPQRNADALFLVSGKDVPQYWLGPETQMKTVDTTLNHLPTKANSTTQPITPAYVATLGNNSHLLYSGESTAPSAVYISDPFFPESFTTPLTQVNPMKGAYNPALIGNNDGVDGGDITGLLTLGSAAVVFKQSAIYSMSEPQLLGDVAFQVETISSSVGCTSSRSIVAMDGFLCFLAIDGVYMTDGNTAQQLSGNVPTYFDSTVLGTPALISNRTNAIAFRHGTRYIIFFDTGSNHPDTGVWFDFAVQADAGLPGCGQMNFTPAPGNFQLYVGGAVTLRGPRDDGNVVIAAANGDFVGKFGLGFSDVSFVPVQQPDGPVPGAPAAGPISVVIRGKADFFEDVFGDDAPAAKKNVDQIHLYVSIFRTTTPVVLTFTGNVISDVADEFPITSLPTQLPALVGPKWGSVAQGGTGERWGSPAQGGTGAIWTAAPTTPGLYFDLPLLSPQNAWGKIVQMEFSETSSFAWSILGYSLQLSKEEVVA